MKKKLLIIAGAGASRDFGMPTVSDIDTLFIEWSKQTYPLSANPDKSLYSYVQEEMVKYYNNCPHDYLKKSANFEEILYILRQLATISKDDLFKQSLRAFSTCDAFPEINLFLHNKKIPEGFDFSNLESQLVDALLNEFRERCQKVQTDKVHEFGLFANFLGALNAEFELGIITPNYDNLFKQAIPTLRTGFDELNGNFLPETVYGNNDWGFCYHIHGSVHFDQIMTKYDFHSIAWKSDLNAKFNQNSSGRSSQDTMEGLSFPTSVIVAGYDKSNQIMRNPFRAYFSQIEKYVLDADAFLFLGYGFADYHLNSCFSTIRDKTPQRPVVIIDYADDTQEPLKIRNDEWAYNLRKTIRFDASRMSYGRYSFTADIGRLKKLKTFEVSKDTNHPLAVWYGGVLDAFVNHNKILIKLKKC